VYHGGGGFIHSEVYNMPIWLRRYHIQQINQFFKDKEADLEKHKKDDTSSNKVMKPNIHPSSTFNFKK
tara:strand:- start:132 stop:335 length:204 start_codon:yes stop_codon:yes gene_type:complete